MICSHVAPPGQFGHRTTFTHTHRYVSVRCRSCLVEANLSITCGISCDCRAIAVYVCAELANNVIGVPYKLAREPQRSAPSLPFFESLPFAQQQTANYSFELAQSFTLLTICFPKASRTPTSPRDCLFAGLLRQTLLSQRKA